MKILREGNLTKTWVGKCNVCGAIVQAEHNELFITELDANVTWNDCPSCDIDHAICFYPDGTDSANQIRLELELV